MPDGARSRLRPALLALLLFVVVGRHAVEAARERELAPAYGSAADGAVTASPGSAPVRQAAFGRALAPSVLLFVH
jgi:hypothetical protein